MKKLADADNSELSSVLEALLNEDVVITVREVARRHTLLKNASAFTRSPGRMALIGNAQKRQADARKLSTEPLRAKSERLQEALTQRNAEVAQLETTVRNLAAAHAGLIRAVMLTGGMSALERFWADFKTVSDTVHGLGAVPVPGQVVRLRERPGSPT
jgi:chemotaxis response regulator CheB